MNSRVLVLGASLTIYAASTFACARLPEPAPPYSPAAISPAPSAVERELRIPPSAVKMAPHTDESPPLLYSDDYELPVPVPGLVNTAGAEDSPFITPDGKTLYFFFTPDVSVPVEQQVLDGVTGIYMSHKADGQWRTPERVILQDPGRAALDGCEFVQGNIMWFCSAREGYTGVNWFTAELQGGVWQNWQLADFNSEYQVGELHISSDGAELYFASSRPGGQGGLDIWLSSMVSGEWQEPVNIPKINTPQDEGWPALNPAADELWFTKNYGVWRSKRANGDWQEPQLILSPLAGEPSIDADGNLFFVHHFFTDDTMIEADIYVAYKK